MKLLELIEVMIQNYRQMFGQFPGKIVIGEGAKNQITQELLEFEYYGFMRTQQISFLTKDKELRTDLKYKGVKIQFDNNEKFIRLESKK
jgi:hypothetical protein